MRTSPSGPRFSAEWDEILKRPPARLPPGSRLFEARQGKRIGNCQNAPLIVFQGDFLRKHDVACYEAETGRKTQADTQSTEIIQLVDISLRTQADPVPFARVAPHDFEIFVLVILFQLIGREPFPQQPAATQFDSARPIGPFAKFPRTAYAGRDQFCCRICAEAEHAHGTYPPTSLG